MTFGDQFIRDTHPVFGRRVLPNQLPDAFKSLFMWLKDDDPILDTSQQIASARQADFLAK
ncbi:MAG: hypothetical protein WCC64_07390 [Aliidongia sp.]